MTSDDPYDLQRFLDAQAPVYRTVLAELNAGTKRTHWMWFIFPQLRGLGHSHTAVRYALSGLDEARAYLDHPVLGSRLRDCTGAILEHSARTATDIFGCPDDLKLRSSLTLFTQAARQPELFVAALDAFFAGKPDDLTLALLGS